MTLVAGLSCGGLPAFLGDLLISWRLPTEVSIPTHVRRAVHPGLNGDYAAGVAQKIIIIRPYLMLAWAGSASAAHDFVKELDGWLPKKSHDLRAHRNLLLQSLNDLGSKSVEAICLVSYKDALYPICVNTKGYDLDDRRIYTLGTGGPEFFSFISEDSETSNVIDEDDGRIAKATLMRFVAHTLMYQISSGYGLAESWGGGFEIAYLKNKRFKKADGMLCRSWKIEPNGEIGGAPAIFLQHYEGSTLCVTTISEDITTTSIPAWVQENKNFPNYQKVVPEYVIDIFLDVRSGRIGQFVKQFLDKSKSHTKFIFRDGHLDDWQMDKTDFDNMKNIILKHGANLPSFMATYPWKYDPEKIAQSDAFA